MTPKKSTRDQSQNVVLDSVSSPITVNDLNKQLSKDYLLLENYSKICSIHISQRTFIDKILEQIVSPDNFLLEKYSKICSIHISQRTFIDKILEQLDNTEEYNKNKTNNLNQQQQQQKELIIKTKNFKNKNNIIKMLKMVSDNPKSKISLSIIEISEQFIYMNRHHTEINKLINYINTLIHPAKINPTKYF
jgi:hypothetical protein